MLLLKYSLLASLILSPTVLEASVILTNGDFEVGATVTPANQDASLAGSPAKSTDYNRTRVVEWMITGLGPASLLVENPAMAQSGNRFFYLRGDSSARLLSFDGAGNGVLDPNLNMVISQDFTVIGPVSVPGSPFLTGWNVTTADTLRAGTTYHLSLWAANAGTTANGVPSPVTVNIAGSASPVALAVNPSWQDTATSVIPWQQISFDFTVTSDTPLWNYQFISASPTNATVPSGSDRTSLVLDNIQLTVVPEPTSTLLGGIFLLGLKRRRTK